MPWLLIISLQCFFFPSEMALLDGGHSELHKDVGFPVWVGTATTWRHGGLGFG